MAFNTGKDGASMKANGKLFHTLRYATGKKRVLSGINENGSEVVYHVMGLPGMGGIKNLFTREYPSGVTSTFKIESLSSLSLHDNVDRWGTCFSSQN